MFLVALRDFHTCNVSSLWAMLAEGEGMHRDVSPGLGAGTLSPEEPAGASHKATSSHLCRIDGAGWESIQGGHVRVPALNSLLGSWAVMDAADDLRTNQRA